MSSLKNTIKMLLMLKQGKLIKKKELAEKLSVSEKQVSRYKEALEEVFAIESITGPNGGYKLLDTYFPIKQLLTEEETMELKHAVNTLGDNIYGQGGKLNLIIDKINHQILHNDMNLVDTQIIPSGKLNIDYEQFNKKQSDIYKAILENREILINYTNNSGESKRRRVQPYKLLTYKGNVYLVANCLESMIIKYFKLVRISDYTVTFKTFDKTIDIEEVLSTERTNSFGIFGGKEYELKLQIKPPMANTIKERIWVENQLIEEMDGGSIIFCANMKGGPEIISWILSMGQFVKIIQPIELRDEVKMILDNMIVNLDR